MTTVINGIIYRITNEQALNIMGVDRRLCKNIRTRRVELVVHTFRLEVGDRIQG